MLRRRRRPASGLPTRADQKGSGLNPGVPSLRHLVGDDSASIPTTLAARVQQTPDRPFLQWAGDTWSYRQAWNEVRSMIGFLEERFSGSARVVSFLANRPEAIWTWLGTVCAGGRYIPINRGHRGEVLADMLRRSSASVLVTEATALSVLPPLHRVGIHTVLIVDEVPPQATTVCPRVWGYQDVHAATPSDGSRSAPWDAACVLYTSGTTGRSKAVLVPHNQYCRGAARLVDAFGLHAGDVFHNWLPLFHLGGQLHMTMSAIVCGGSVALFPTFSRSRFWSQVRETESTVICGFTAILRMLWSLPSRPNDLDNPLRVGIISGIPADLHKPFERRFGIRLGENYGLTEADPMTIPRPGVETPIGSCGLAGPDFEIAVLDDDDRPVAPGQIGHIAARPLAPGVMMLGYEGDEEATLAAWRNLWLRTGDLGWLDERSFLYYRGRESDAIRRRGENVSPAEVEAILKSHPDVVDCAVVPVPSPLGEDDIKAVVVPREDRPLSPPVIHHFAVDRMARFMVPRYIEIRSALPKTELGKVVKAQLKQLGLEVWDAERE